MKKNEEKKELKGGIKNEMYRTFKLEKDGLRRQQKRTESKK